MHSYISSEAEKDKRGDINQNEEENSIQISDGKVGFKILYRRKVLKMFNFAWKTVCSLRKLKV